jgi:hypothetical protein
MSSKGLRCAVTFLSLALLPSPALAQGGAKDDGKIIEQARFALPTFEQENYRRSLEPNPQNTNATDALKRIGQ